MKYFITTILLLFFPVFFVNAKIIDSIELENDVILFAETTKPTEKNVLNKNTEKISDNIIRIFSVDQFALQDNIWHEVNIATTTKFDFLIKESEELSEEVEKFSFFNVVNAQTALPWSLGWGYSRALAKNSWALARDEITANDVSTTANMVGANYAGGKYYLYRSHNPFDYTSLSPVNITSATFGFRTTLIYNTDNDGSDYVAIYESNQASLTTLTTADYGRITSNKLTEKKDFEVLTSHVWNFLDFDEEGLSFLNGTTTPKLMMREGHDVDNVAIVGDNEFNIISSYLEITYEDETPPEEEEEEDYFLPMTYIDGSTIAIILGIFNLFLIFLIFNFFQDILVVLFSTLRK